MPLSDELSIKIYELGTSRNTADLENLINELDAKQVIYKNA